MCLQVRYSHPGCQIFFEGSTLGISTKMALLSRNLDSDNMNSNFSREDPLPCARPWVQRRSQEYVAGYLPLGNFRADSSFENVLAIVELRVEVVCAYVGEVIAESEDVETY